MGLPNPESGSAVSDALARLLQDRIVYLGGLSQPMVSAVVAQLKALECDSRPATLTVRCSESLLPGVLAVYEAMQSVPYELATVALGKVEYATTLLVAAGTPGKRAASASSSFLLGPPVIEMGGMDFQAYLKAVQSHCETLNGLLARHTGQSLQRLAGFTQPTELSPAEARELGLIDMILP